VGESHEPAPSPYAAPGAFSDEGTLDPRSPWYGRLELIMAVLLGLAAITSAYAAFKNE
jgi:hypothetical protein